MPNFYTRIEEAAARFADRAAIEMAGPSGVAETSYAALIDTTGQFARWLSDAAGIRQGDRVAILSGNSARWVAAYLGILRIGAVVVPLDTAYSSAQVRTILADSGAGVLLTSAQLHDTGLAATTGLPAVEVALLTMAFESRAPVGGPATHVEEAEAAAILYTSGTTADPKGVVLTHGNLEAERAAAFAVLHVTEHDAVLGVLPLFHALAQMANLLLPLTAGTRVVFLEAVNSTALLEALQSRGITIFACVPQFFYLIHERVMGQVATRGAAGRAAFRLLVAVTRLMRDSFGVNPGPWLFGRVHRVLGRHMRLLITGGSRFDPRIARDLHGLGLTLLNGYGLTETSGAATLVRPGDRFTTSVGHPLPGVDIRIDMEHRNDVPGVSDQGEGEGEVLLRGPILMREYFNRPDATREALDNGWLRTGDLGRLDAEGRLYITGRKKEVIVLSSGKNLYPEEIEGHYRQSVFIRELCVMGLSDPGAPAAERLHAVIVPDDAVLRERGIVNVRELIRFEIEGLAVQFPPHKRILSYDIATEPLARTTTGKLKRAEIERQRQARVAVEPGDRELTPDERQWLATGPRHSIVAAIQKRLAPLRVHPDDNLELDLHLDSMERVEVLAMLERRTGNRVPPPARAAIFTVRHLVEAIELSPGSPRAAAFEDDGHGAGGEWETLLATPAEPAVARDLARPVMLRAMFFHAALQGCALAARLLLRVRVSGTANLPTRGPYLITPNHQSFLDGFFLTAALPFHAFREVFFVGASEYFTTRVTRGLARSANIVSVDPDTNLVSAMQAAAAGLRLNKVLMLFPEGERSIDGGIRPFRKGAAILATHLGVPVVPAALDGLHGLWPRGRPFNWRRLLSRPRHTIMISFAAPIQLHGVSDAEGTARLQTAVQAAFDRAADD